MLRFQDAAAELATSADSLATLRATVYKKVVVNTEYGGGGGGGRWSTPMMC